MFLKVPYHASAHAPFSFNNLFPYKLMVATSIDYSAINKCTSLMSVHVLLGSSILQFLECYRYNAQEEMGWHQKMVWKAGFCPA